MFRVYFEPAGQIGIDRVRQGDARSSERKRDRRDNGVATGE